MSNSDDIDHLQTRRIRSCGELLEIQLGEGIERLQKTIIDKINNKGLFYLTLQQDQKINLSNQKPLLDWMGMNEEILSRPISNLELWFLPEFVRLYNTYKMKPWVIPIKLLLFNSNIKKNASENKSITGNKKRDPFISISSNEKKSLESENRNQEVTAETEAQIKNF